MVTTTTFGIGSGEFGRGKTLLALTVVIGCFAVLWPKIFYPMLASSLFSGYQDGEGNGDLCCDVIFEKDTNAYKIMNELCSSIIQKEGLNPVKKVAPNPKPVAVVVHPPKNKWYKNYTGPEDPQPDAVLSTSDLCRNEIMTTCKIDVTALLKENPTMSKEYKESLAELRSFNVSQCLKDNYDVHLEGIGLPKRVKLPDSSPRHMRPERPIHMPQTVVHPALREKGNAIPHPQQRRPIEMDARQPQPGMRPPPMVGLNAPPPPRGGGGTMGVVMPLYTIAIVCFFLYTIFKIVFRKSEEPPPVKDTMRNFSIDSGNNRRYADDYQGNNRSTRGDPYYRDFDYGVRRRSSVGIAPIPTVPMVQDITVPRQTAPIGMTAAIKDTRIENGSGPKERDAIVAAVQGILADVDKSLAAPKSLPKIEKHDASENSEDAQPKLKEAEPEQLTCRDLPKTTLDLKEPDYLRRKGGHPKRPPTPIRIVDSASEPEESDEDEDEKAINQEKPMFESCELVKFAQELSSLILKQGLSTAAVTLAFANRKEAGKGHLKHPPADLVAVVGMDESVGLENGQKWTDRSPTPTFPRHSSPLPPHKPPTPPAEVPNIYLEGPIPSPANQILISNSECEEVDMDDDYDYEDDEDYDSENDKPVILSGKVTLSVLSGMGEDKTEAPSFSAYEEVDKVVGQLENAIKEVASSDNHVGNESVPTVAQQSKGSSPDMDEYEVVGKEGLNNGLQSEESEQTRYTTADVDIQPGNPTGEETSADISVMEGLNDADEEEEYDEEEEEEDEEEEEEEEENEEEEEEEEEEIPANAPAKGTTNKSPTPSSQFSSPPPSSCPYGTYFTEL